MNFSSPTKTMLLEIFKHLPTEDIMSLKGTCQKWNCVANSNLLWKWKYHQNFTKPLEKIKNIQSRNIQHNRDVPFEVSYFVKNMSNIIIVYQENNNENWKDIYHTCQHVATNYTLSICEHFRTIGLSEFYRELLECLLEMDLFLLDHDKFECNIHQKYKNGFIIGIGNFGNYGVLTYLTTKLIKYRQDILEIWSKFLMKRPLKYKLYSANDIYIFQYSINISNFNYYPIKSGGDTLLTYILKNNIRNAGVNIEDLLADYGCDPNKKNLDGQTPLSCALTLQFIVLEDINSGKNKNIVFEANDIETLLKYGADPNLADNDGTTPLLRAYNIEKSLLNSSSYKRYTHNGNSLKLLLLKYGANPYQMLKNTQSPSLIEVSIENNNEIIKKYHRDFDLYLNLLVGLMIIFALWTIKEMLF
jgi:hypothetical protein